MVQESDLRRISTNATELNAKAMLLTDAWGAMFILDPETVKNTVATLGMPKALGQKFYDAVRAVSIVDTRNLTTVALERRPFTWHMLAASILVVRRQQNLGTAMAWVNDSTLERFVDANSDLFKRVMAIQPDYASYLLFSPRVASNVLAVFGAAATPDTLLRIASRYGVISAEDAAGRKGIACKFARSLALLIASKSGQTPV
jgi:hypothetical protein